jgi:MFS family permease
MVTRRSAHGLDGVNFFMAAMQTAFGSFVVVHLVNSHWPGQAIGFALTIGTISSLVSQVPAGVFIDSILDKRRAVWLGIVGVGVAALLLGLSTARPVVYFAQTLQGLGSSLIGPGIASISLALVGRTAFSERIGRNARFASIGNGLTAAVMGLAGAYFASTAVFLVAAMLAVPALLSLLFVGAGCAQSPADPAGRQARSGQETATTWDGLKSLLLDRRLLIFAACIVLFFASSAAMQPGVAALMTRRHPEFTTLIVAAMILLPQAIVATLAPWIGRSADRLGRRPMLLLGWGLLPLQGLLYAILWGPYTLLICQVMSGVSGAVFGVLMTLVAADLTHGTGRFNLTLGALGVMISLGASLSTFVGGVLAAAFSPRTADLALSTVAVFGLLLLWLGMPETHPIGRLADSRPAETPHEL